MEQTVNSVEMKKYIIEKFTAEGDFDFLPDGMLEKMVDKLMELDTSYIEKANETPDGIYDDDEAYDAIFAGMQAAFGDYRMYCMRLTEDYMDFAEEYMAKAGIIEWV